MTETVFDLTRGTAPLLISIPHLGTVLPEALQSRFTAEAGVRADTDWHLDRLYAVARALGASVLGARISRYVIDLNRPPDGQSLYPGQTTTGLCPGETFRGVLPFLISDFVRIGLVLAFPGLALGLVRLVS